jgi:hypothetical protein
MERARGIYTHHPKTSCWLLSLGDSGKPLDTPKSPKLAIRFKSSGYSGVFGKSGVSRKFPRISEASLDSTSHLREKTITFLLRTPNSMILDSMESLFRGASIPTENKLQNHQVHAL